MFVLTRNGCYRYSYGHAIAHAHWFASFWCAIYLKQMGSLQSCLAIAGLHVKDPINYNRLQRLVVCLSQMQVKGICCTTAVQLASLPSPDFIFELLWYRVVAAAQKHLLDGYPVPVINSRCRIGLMKRVVD